MTASVKKRFARYGLEKNKIRDSGVHPSLFHPAPNGILSVQATDDMNDAQIKSVGLEVASERNKNLYGWGTVSRSTFQQLGLTICTNDDPRPGHTNIGGWLEYPEIISDLQKDLAEAANAVGHVRFACCTA